MSKAMIEVYVEEWCKDTSIEVVEVFDWDEEKYDIIEFNLYDYLENHKKFESDGSVFELLQPQSMNIFSLF